LEFCAAKLQPGIVSAASVPPEAINIHVDFERWSFACAKLQGELVPAASVPPEAISILADFDIRDEFEKYFIF